MSDQNTELKEALHNITQVSEKRRRRVAELEQQNAELVALCKRANNQLGKWQEFYGMHCNGPTMGNVLPPAGDVQLAEAIDAAIEKAKP